MPVTPAIFAEKVKRFLNHKRKLATVSHYYKASFIAQRIQQLNQVFGDFLAHPKTYPVGQLAIKVKKYEDLLMAVLPVPNNPSYESSLHAAKELITEAHEILKQLNLTDYV
jgi:Ni,Fe-hydrogenase I large subunit